MDKPLLPVLFDALHAYAPNLFTSASKKRARQPFKVNFQYNGDEIEATGRRGLNAFDLLTLEAVLYLAGRNAEPAANVALTEGLALEGDFKDAAHVWLKISYAALARLMGRPCTGNFIARVKDSFHTLWSQGFFIRNPNTQIEGGFHLLSYSAKRGQVEVGLDPFLSRALVRERNYTLLSLTESRELSDPARVLHLRLCNRAGKGEKTFFTRSQLQSVPWW